MENKGGKKFKNILSNSFILFFLKEIFVNSIRLINFEKVVINVEIG